ncbi:MAG: DUF2062 domain-containing protein [Gammaproteobacteria bacterium]|nr:DUF2062 domain-containing protein [Gammaproteobacteria bacterium]
MAAALAIATRGHRSTTAMSATVAMTPTSRQSADPGHSAATHTPHAASKPALRGKGDSALLECAPVMVRNFLRSLRHHARALGSSWYARPFARVFDEPGLWSMQRRSITAAFGAGLAICFVPLPIHTVLALLVAAVARLNVPTIIGTIWIVNPITMVPIFYFAYTVGCWMVGAPSTQFAFELSWAWLEHGLGPMWLPFLTGCAACAAAFGIGGWLLLDRLWIWHARYRYRTRHRRSNV